MINLLINLVGYVVAFLVGREIARVIGHSRHYRCAWCYRPYAFWNRAGSACCVHHKRIIDSAIDRLSKTTRGA